jgi:hypothetical protein
MCTSYYFDTYKTSKNIKFGYNSTFKIITHVIYRIGLHHSRLVELREHRPCDKVYTLQLSQLFSTVMISIYLVN